MTSPAAPASTPASPPPDPVLAPAKAQRRQLPLYFWAAVSLLLLLAYNAIFDHSFFHMEVASNGHLVGKMVNILNFGSKVMLLSLGMTLVIATGGIDLSVGAIMAIAGGVSALLINDKNVTTDAAQVPASVWLALAAGLGAGLLAGLWNGVLIGYVKIQPIIATLILMISGRDLAIYLTNGQAPTLNLPTVVPPQLVPIQQFLFIGRGEVIGIPPSTLLTGGVGGIPGTLIGLLTYATIQSAMSLHSFPTGVDRMVIGGLLLAFVLLQKLLQFRGRTTQA